jgi:predicted Zn-dependent protease
MLASPKFLGENGVGRSMQLGRVSNLLIRLSTTPVAVAFLAVACSAQQSQVGNVVGEIRIARQGLPPKQVLVNLQARGASINSAYTDSQGHFGFYALPGGVYTVNIDDDDYLPVTQEVVLDLSISTMARASVTLNPRPAVENKRAGTRVAGSNPNEIDINELSRQFPPKAVQEYEKGLKATGDGDVQSAARHFQRSLILAPGFYPAHNELGRGYLAKSDFPAAQHEFEEVIRLNQSDAEAYLNLGNVLLLTNHYAEAFAQVQEGLRRDPKSAVGQFVLGSVYQKMQKADESERALREALRLDPKMNKVHLALVNVYLSQDKKPEAMNELKDFLKLAPDDPLSAKCREVLHKLESENRGVQ